MSSPTPPSEQSRRRLLASAIAVLVLLAVGALTWWIDGRSSPDEASPPASSVSIVDGSTTTAADRSRTDRPGPSDTPARVEQTLQYIDAGDWPAAANAPGTHGGDTFRNNERRLPVKSTKGKRIQYREWDVNPKQRGRGRDAERIITGSDGSAYYTLDHYETFTKIRGPSS
ncbi:hypothetical protein nbrc107696_18200 [Gordonia spumicola]|uniref:Uncharacterized protein n=1 Tax=Gordonia spumicola TaxID=589161 RepID=A0A7I9V824_9ACTN|nr:ribonuclease domain-containing protein [Gordonia spumicola]GEE01374.1 hypothetical protein nbrc107696_18200 [Gordonia spumicola]